MPKMRYCPQCAQPLQERTGGDRPRLACADETCGFVAYDNPIPVVAAIVEHEGDVVLVRNKGWPEKWFGLVSGFLERGESPEEGVLREVKEELGLDAVVVRLVGLYPFHEMNQLIVAFHVRATGEPVAGEELAGFKRVSPDHLRPWPMGTGQAVADWLAARVKDAAGKG